jgi:cobalt-zinc-cadmium efflux system membrane fusion protein
MKRNHLRFAVLAATAGLLLIIGGVYSGGDGGQFAYVDTAYAQGECPDDHDHADNGDVEGHQSDVLDTDHVEHETDTEHDDHGEAAEPDDHGEAAEHDDHAEGEVLGNHGEVEDSHEGHDHDVAEGVESGHEGHDHAAEDVLRLSPEAIRLAGIRIATATVGRLHRTIELPGEIGFDEDRMVHVTPRYPGVAREVHGRLGAFVREGEVLAVLESNESLSRYNITAPISGRIIEKHLTVGEFAAEDHDMFLVADLSTVWANCEVYAKDMPYVTQGAKVRITAVEGGRSVDATLAYVAPVYDGETRSALARAVIANDGDIWRPGAFIRAELAVEVETARLTVEKEAVQTLVEQKVLFVPGDEEGAFELVPVLTGIAGEHSVEILSGIEAGTQYVVSGAFELKAKMVTANMGAHAGHGH